MIFPHVLGRRLGGLEQPAASASFQIARDIPDVFRPCGVDAAELATHGLKPTEAGRNFYESAKQSIEAAEEAEFAARGAATTLSGRLRFCAPVTFTRLHVMPRLSIAADAAGLFR